LAMPHPVCKQPLVKSITMKNTEKQQI
jgi:hypothetical protein